MKQYLMKGFVATALAVVAVGCSEDVYDANLDADVAKYETAFKQHFGLPAADQDWGFGSFTTSTLTRSQSAPAVADISAPYDATWVAGYLLTASEPTSANVEDNYDNSYTASCQWYATANGKLSTLLNNYDNCIYEGSPVTQADKDWYTANVKGLMEACGKNWNADSETAYNILQVLKSYTGDYNYWDLTVNSEGGYVADATYVKNFKVIGTWNGPMRVVASEGIKDGSTLTGAERTVVVTGTWNLTASQRVGSLGKIIVADGGTINISSGAALELVNQARLVVLRGGTITGQGEVMITNGNAVGLEGYNGGTINVHKVNNNFGKFYNYGVLKADIYAAGSKESNIYNHGIVHIKGTKENGNYVSSNARIFNACQWYCEGDMRARNIEEVQGASMIVDGELMMSGSEDGTTDASYVGLEAGALVKCGTLYNNGTSWTGPTSNGYAVVAAGQITYLNWAQDTFPLEFGYFENNIYMYLEDGTNDPDGNGNHVNDDEENYPYRANWKFEHIVANGLDGGTVGRGNGNVKLIQAGTTEIIPADANYVKGVSGCTPGFRGDVDPTPDPDPETFIPVARIMCEDLSAEDGSDFDFNDVVFSIQWTETGAKIRLEAAGGTLPLTVGGVEVHAQFKVGTQTMVNTMAGHKSDYQQPIFEITGNFKNAQGDYDANLIPVLVFKHDEWKEMTAIKGRAASKICVDPQTDWCDEYQDIDDKWNGQFSEWVKGQRATFY